MVFRRMAIFVRKSTQLSAAQRSSASGEVVEFSSIGPSAGEGVSKRKQPFHHRESCLLK